MKRGDRVEIRGEGLWCDGQQGTITVEHRNSFEIVLDKPSRSASTTVRKEYLMALVDPNKPLRFRMPDMRPVKLVGVLPNGNMLIVSTYGESPDSTDWWPTPWIINQHGERMATGGKYPLNDPFQARVVNDVVVTRGFYPMFKHANGCGPDRGRGLISASAAFSEYETAAYCVEIVCHDGVPKEAHIHARSDQA
ncbi:MAG: hypothetical protein ABW128_16970 [Rhizorhabdus sp.]